MLEKYGKKMEKKKKGRRKDREKKSEKMFLREGDSQIFSARKNLITKFRGER